MDEKSNEEYYSAKSAYDENDKLISESDSKIQKFDSDLHDIEKSLSALNGEKSAIKTDTGFSDTDTKNKLRISTIEAKIKELNVSKEKIAAEKENEVKNNETLKDMLILHIFLTYRLYSVFLNIMRFIDF